MAGYPLMKQNNWTLTSVAELDGQGPYWNAKDDTTPPTPVSLTAGGNSGAGLVAATSSTSTPANATSSPSSTATPGDGVKKSSAHPRWDSPLLLMLSVGILALANNVWAVM